MKRFLIIAILALAALGAWYASWRSAMSPHVAFIERNIVEANKRYKTPNYRATIEYKSIRPTGFPFGRSVVVEAPSINMIYANETYVIRLPMLGLTLEDEMQGRYRLILPTQIGALYVVNGQAPERYEMNASGAPRAWLRVRDTRPGCQGSTCLPSADALFKEFGFQLPAEIQLEARLGAATDKIVFRQMAMPVPHFIDIPDNISRPTFLFVMMLREALVFKTPHPQKLS